MTDHPNRFAIGDQVLFRSRSGKGYEWREGAVVVVRAADREDPRREYPSGSDRWEATQRGDTPHQADCEWIYYDVLPEGTPRSLRNDKAERLLCVCAHQIVAAGDWSRWTGQQLTERSEYQLLLTDLNRDGLDLIAHAQADNTVQLTSGTVVYAVVNLNNLIVWAAGTGLSVDV